MNSVARVRRSLRAPIKKLASCVSGLKGRRPGAKRWTKRARGGGGRGGWSRPVKTPPVRVARTKEPMVIHSYQADLEKERQVGRKCIIVMDTFINKSVHIQNQAKIS